jgi:hypothetical protein
MIQWGNTCAHLSLRWISPELLLGTMGDQFHKIINQNILYNNNNKTPRLIEYDGWGICVTSLSSYTSIGTSKRLFESSSRLPLFTYS